MKKFDIIIAGGGMVGATAALALSQLPLKIAIVEPFKPALNASPSFDQRAVALSASSVAIFKSLKLWPKIQSLGCAITDIHISDQGHFGFTRLHASDYNMNALGQVIPLDQTGPILWQAMQTTKNIEIFCPANITSIDTNMDTCVNTSPDKSQANRIGVGLTDSDQNQQQISATLLLAADGTFSSIARMASIETKRCAYNQHAVIANISTELAHNHRAFERFTQHGPLALLPLTRNRMSLVWCQSEHNLARVMAYDDEKFIQMLQKEFGYRLGQITKVGQRSEYPLSLHIPERVFNGRVLLLGNSAHTLHPIAGQGFNLGLRDIATLYDEIKRALNNQSGDIGSQSFLESYQSKRRADWDRTIKTTDLLVKLFSQEFLPVVIARNKALSMIDKLPFIKQKLAMAAMGFSGESANLTRGID